MLEEFEDIFYERFSGHLPITPHEAYESVLFNVFNWVLNHLKHYIYNLENTKKQLIELSNKINSQLLQLTKSEELREILKEYTERMNALNAKTTEYLDKIDAILSYLQNTKDQLEKEIRRKGIKIR